MKLIELIIIAAIIIGLLAYMIIENGNNQERMNTMSLEYQDHITMILNESSNNLTRLTTGYEANITAKQNEVNSKISEISTLNSQLTDKNNVYNALLTRYNGLNGTITTRINGAVNNVTKILNETNRKYSNLSNDYKNLSKEFNETINNSLVDPTSQELTSFLASDNTSLHVYNNTYGSSYYVCVQFSRDLMHNSSLHGFRCYPVEMDLYDYTNDTYYGHTIVCYNTTDFGIIYVEPQTDEKSFNLGYLSYYTALGIPYMIMNLEIMWQQ